jgi:hypothetical protein
MADINTIPLDCLCLIARVSVRAYRALLLIKRFALTTLNPDVNLKYRMHFTVEKYNPEHYHRIIFRLNGRPHRDGDLPALITGDGDKHWYQYGELHRDGDQPASVYISGDKYWYQWGELHRDGDNPAMILASGSQYWYQHGVVHRDNDLPAVIWSNNHRQWWQCGLIHRSGNPAIICANGDTEWWSHGNRVMNPSHRQLRIQKRKRYTEDDT